VELDELDLGDLASVHAFARGFLDTGRSIDILVHNAGIMALPETRIGAGWEAQFGTNHLGPFALTNLLWPALAINGGARVVALASNGHKLCPIRFDDLQFNQGYDKWLAYGQSKTANCLFAVHLDAVGQDAGVRAFAAYPGPVITPVQRYITEQEMRDWGWIDEDGNHAEMFKSPAAGAATPTWAATAPALDGLGGVYCEDCDIAKPTVVGSPTERDEGVDAHAIDPDVAARLWRLSAGETGVDAFAPA
jgi:NAD(P)-dependent dehydrogenase (short-subunit alcohol dehydrogenase family)